MNIIKLLDNKFLQSLFPNGIDGDVLIGQIYLDVADQVLLSIHTSQSPDKPVAKWGDWDKDYNVIVINVLAQFISRVEVNNWQNIKKSPLFIYAKENGVYSLSSKGSDWDLTIDFKCLTFQRCDVYIK